jgi:hypothetical protein
MAIVAAVAGTIAAVASVWPLGSLLVSKVRRQPSLKV